MGRMLKSILGFSPTRVNSLYKGKGKATQILQQIGQAYLQGCNMALENSSPESLGRRLNAIEPEYRGFAAEGVGTGLTLLDYFTPWNRSRLQAFLNGPGAIHIYMLHVGAGWVFARLRRFSRWPFTQLDPFMRWFILDGYGCHDGFFYWQHYTQKQALPKGFSGYEYRAFDQGFGRSIWFMAETDVAQIAATIALFPPTRQSDLWSGVGTACSFAGGVDRATIDTLRSVARPHQIYLALGATYGARVRQLANIWAPHTELACQILCSMSAEDAANVSHAAMKDLPPDGQEPAFEIWRRRIQAHFADM
ncbi:MAG: DUF1702 family protein [Chloroflexi bacterium]|nr:DUF1702 family protein [Chloroflexota bacterium]